MDEQKYGRSANRPIRNVPQPQAVTRESDEARDSVRAQARIEARERIEARLDAALDMTFPASDPVAFAPPSAQE